MGVKLDYEWLSDPLLLYALGLSALLFGGIFILILTIIIKHSRRLHGEKIQNDFTLLLHQAKELNKDGKDIRQQISNINFLIQNHKKDVAYGWVRLLEQSSPSDRTQYIAIATQTNLLYCIPHCLHDGGMAEKCIALEAIGLSQFQDYLDEVRQYSEESGLAPYACIALARLIGKGSLPQIIESYEKGVLTTTQALAAIVELPHTEVIDYIKNSSNKAFPKQINHYLKTT